MREAVLSQAVVAAPAIGENCGAWFNHIANERYEAIARDIPDPSYANAAKSLRKENLDGNENDGLVFRTTPPFSFAVYTANVRLINLHRSLQPVGAGSHHRASQFV